MPWVCLCLSAQEKHKNIKDVEFEAVPRSVRGNVKLCDVNTLYTQLTEHFSDYNRCEAYSIAKKILRIIVPSVVSMVIMIYCFPLFQSTSEFPEDE